jgi:hypothetical protein
MGKTIKKYSKSSIEEIEGAKSVGGPCCWTPDDFNYKNKIFNLKEHQNMKKVYFQPFYDCYYFSDPIFIKIRKIWFYC